MPHTRVKCCSPCGVQYSHVPGTKIDRFDRVFLKKNFSSVHSWSESVFLYDSVPKVERETPELLFKK